MNLRSCILLLFLPFFVASCHYPSLVAESKHDPFLIQGDDLMHGEWADDSRMTKDIRCRGVLQGGELLCDIVNISDHDIILNRGVCGFGYLIKYQSRTGKVIDTDWTYAVGSEGLGPGESCKWKMSVEKDLSIKDCDVSIMDYK